MRKISPISSHGVYTKEDMESFQHTLMFPGERKAVTNEVARRVTGKNSGTENYYMPNLFSQNEFRSLARSAAVEVWGFLSEMGNIFSVCCFLYTICCIISYGASVITNYFTIKKVTKDHPKRRRYLWASLWQALAHRYIYRLHVTNLDPERQALAMEETPHNPEATEMSVSRNHCNQPSSSAATPHHPAGTPCYNMECLASG